MSFTEYRGGGKSAADVESMESRWDCEWARSKRGVNVSDMVENENWTHIQRKILSGRVLEAGCGIAKWVAFLDVLGYETYGIDNSTVAIQQSLKIWPNLRLSQGDLRAIPFDNVFFEGIICFGAIEHDIKGPQAALLKCIGCCAREGRSTVLFHV
jgi:SAM-dependent methyltransferase